MKVTQNHVTFIDFSKKSPVIPEFIQNRIYPFKQISCELADFLKISPNTVLNTFYVWYEIYSYCLRNELYNLNECVRLKKLFNLNYDYCFFSQDKLSDFICYLITPHLKHFTYICDSDDETIDYCN